MGFNRLFLNSNGLNTEKGAKQIRETLYDYYEIDLPRLKVYIVSLPEYEIDDIILKNCITILDMKEENIRFSKRSYPDEEFDPDIVYVTEGNTFEVLKYMKELGIFKYIKKLARDKSKDLIYIGSSAGAMIAGDDIMLAKDFDSNTVGLYDYTSLGLFEGAVVPHYTEEQLKLYIESTEKHILERYYTIYSVSNDEMLEL